jgi:hypothetical protein
MMSSLSAAAGRLHSIRVGASDPGADDPATDGFWGPLMRADTGTSSMTWKPASPRGLPAMSV